MRLNGLERDLKPDWYLVGLLPLAFGILSYIIAISRSVPIWGLLWVCPVTAVATGVILPSRNRFAISAVAAWILNGPFPVAVAETASCFQLDQFHHIVSAAVLFIILYHWRDIWNTKGILFGVASFYAFTVITVNLSGGVVNLLRPMEVFGPPPLWVGMLFAMLSVIIFLWHKLEP